MLFYFYVILDVTVEKDMNKVIQIQQTLVGDFPPLYGKRFIFEGNLNKITSRLIIKCHMFLFDDIILYSHSKLGSFWRYKGTIELKTAWVRVLEGGETYKNVFQIVGPKKTWTFYANSQEELNIWLDHLNGAISAIVEKDPSLIDQRADVSVKMGRGLWRILSINRRKDYDKEFSEALKNEAEKEITNEANSPEKSDETEPTTVSASSPSVSPSTPSQDTEKQEKVNPKEDTTEKKPEEIAKPAKESKDLSKSGGKSPKFKKRNSYVYQRIDDDSYDDEEEGEEEKEKFVEPNKDESNATEKPSTPRGQISSPRNYSTIVESSGPSVVTMSENPEVYEEKSLLGSPEKTKKKSSIWCCC